jgi:hypothetical protein
MLCEEKQRLLEAYQSATQRHSVAVTELWQKAGTLSRADYDVLSQRTEGLHHDADAAELQYKRHTLEHHC